MEWFLRKHRAEDAGGKAVITRFMPMFAETMSKKRMRNSEVLQNTDKMLLREYLKPAFEHLKATWYSRMG